MSRSSIPHHTQHVNSWPAFQQWPEESIKQFAEMLRSIIREELRPAPTCDLADMIRTQGVDAVKRMQHAKLKESRK